MAFADILNAEARELVSAGIFRSGLPTESIKWYVLFIPNPNSPGWCRGHFQKLEAEMWEPPIELFNRKVSEAKDAGTDVVMTFDEASELLHDITSLSDLQDNTAARYHELQERIKKARNAFKAGNADEVPGILGFTM